MKTITTRAARIWALLTVAFMKPELRKGTYRLGLIGIGILTLSLLAALLPVAISFAQGVSFGSATNYPVAAGGWNPHSVAVGDVNGDGKLDLAVADNNGNTFGQVSIFLGNGDGSFGAATNFAAQGGPVSVAMGDLNGDTILDLAVVNHSSHSVSILLGVGDGSFSAATNYAVGTHPLSIAMGDLNGDGKADLAVANQDSNNVSILINNGSGSFSAAPNLAVGTNPRSIAIGDLNGDGKQDLAVANTGSHNISILLNSGNGSFGAATNFAAASGPFSVAIGDLNADGKPDLAIVNDNNTNANVAILLNTGAGSFGAATYFGAGSGPSSVALGDFNGDGKTDLAVANYAGNNASILLGTGAGSFGAPANFGAGSGPRSVAVGDFNGDEKPDLAVVNYWSHNVSILLNTCSQCTTPTISPVGLTLTEGSSSVNATIANVNDTEDAENALTVTINGSATVNGVTVSSISVNNAGVVTADIVAACNATTASFTLTVTDPGGLSTNATLTVTVNANAPPTLGTYLTASVNGSGSTTVPPNVPPSDNGSINSISTTSPSFTGGLSVNPATGVVTISNAGLGGDHIVTVTATDNCGATNSTSFTLTVTCLTNPIVTNNNDSGAGSLRQAIADACVGSTITFANNATGTITLTTGELGIFKNLTIQGLGANLLTISGNNASRVFATGAASLTISGVTISAGNGIGTNPTGQGGGICNLSGTLTIANSTVSFNMANFGGGIYNAGTVNIINSTVSGNTTIQSGGGIHNDSGTIATITNSTISGNIAGRDAGGIDNPGTVTITNSTISNNTASNGQTGGGIRNSGMAKSQNTIIAKNTAPGGGPDVMGNLISLGFNLIGNSSGANIQSPQPTDQIGTAANPIDPLLGPLAFNGGPTQTMVLLPGSPAIDKGSAVAGVTTDQRGQPRPIDFSFVPNATGGNGSDIGTVEAQSLTNAPPIINGYNITRKQGSAGSVETIAVVSDDYTPAGTMNVIPLNSIAGITITNIVNTNGTITANVTAGCSAPLGYNTILLQVTDGGGLTRTSNLGITVTANTLPILTYSNPSVAAGGSLTINPTTGPSDNGSVSSIAVQNIGTYTGTISVNSSGVVWLSNAAPVGMHTITIRATDNCGAMTDATFTLNVACANLIVSNNADSGAGSLRQAIANACVGGAITFANTVTSPITLASELVINKNLTIQGPGANLLTISGNNNSRIFYIAPATVVTIEGLTITKGNGLGAASSGNGGGIFNAGKLNLTNSAVTNSTVGGIYNSGTLTLNSSTVSGNLGGSGISNFSGSLTIVNSTISGNRSSTGYGGGGILNFSSYAGNATTTVSNSTIAENIADAPPGFQGRGDAIADAFSPLNSITVKNSILASPSQGLGDDCYISAGVLSLGYNIVSDNSGGLSGTGDMNNTNPLLGPLANNGGSTQTHALLFGSPALDKGSAATGITTDQRGLPRPVDLSSIANATGGNGSDIGAFETQTVATPPGTNVTVQSDAVAITFPTVSTGGVTTVMPINPSAAGTVPNGYQLGNLAYEISTTASITPPIIVCFSVPSVTDPTVFANLRILHNEGGVLTDRTILSGPQAPNFTAKTICASVNSLSPFVLAQLLNNPPTISNASASPPSLWPANHNPVDVAVGYNTNAYWGPATCTLSVTSNEPDFGLDADDLPNDIEVVNPHLVRLRAERASGGNGRSYTITITCTDSLSQVASQNVIVTVNTPPSITALANTRQQGSPAMTSNIATVSDPDQSAGSLVVTFSDGATSKTVNGVTVSISPNTNGTISASIAAACTATAANFTVKATDNLGATATANLTVNVTANAAPAVTITGPASGSVYPIGTAVTFTGSFTDDTTGLYTAQWKYDSIVQAGTVNANAVSGAYTFTTAGVYLVSLSVTDACGATGTASTLGELSALVVIYDPNGGFVTGGGWINSPAGAYVDNPVLTGKANFGFVSKYQNGNSVPTGNTEFQFKAGNLNFSSTVYEWMVIAGARAQYKGSGKINGAGDYRFMLTAIDGQVNGGGGQDKFRIRIWNNAGGGLVYDNQMNAPDSADPTTVLGGGSIVIHK